jgi:flavin reductase (DIM6/NTAB) family NADH-FMN oxidoreductase RutF
MDRYDCRRGADAFVLDDAVDLFDTAASIPAAAADPARRSDSTRALRRALGSFATGVTVVTGLTPAGMPIGLTVNSFASVSLDPPLVLWSLRRTSVLVPCFAVRAPFAVHVLQADQEGLARRFAAHVDDRFAGVPWRAGPHGVPHVDGVLARFECRVEAVHEAGDHVVFVAGVEAFRATRGTPLLFANGAFRRLAADDG